MSTIEKILGTDKFPSVMTKVNAVIDAIEAMKTSFSAISKEVQSYGTRIQNLENALNALQASNISEVSVESLEETSDTVEDSKTAE